MDPKKFKSRMGDLALGSALGAAARDYKKEMEAQYRAQNQSCGPAHEDFDLDDLVDDPELEKLHAEHIASLKKEAEKRAVLSRKGHGEYKEVTEGEFLGEVTGSERMACHFFHKEFVRCKIMDKHLQSLAMSYFDTRFIKVDADNCPFFVTKLAVKVLPCVILFRFIGMEWRLTELLVLRNLEGRMIFPEEPLRHGCSTKISLSTGNNQNVMLRKDLTKCGQLFMPWILTLSEGLLRAPTFQPQVLVIHAPRFD